MVLGDHYLPILLQKEENSLSISAHHRVVRVHRGRPSPARFKNTFRPLGRCIGHLLYVMRIKSDGRQGDCRVEDGLCRALVTGKTEERRAWRPACAAWAGGAHHALPACPAAHHLAPRCRLASFAPYLFHSILSAGSLFSSHRTPPHAKPCYSSKGACNASARVARRRSTSP